MHKLVYEFDDQFYDQHIHEYDTALGLMCSGGTIANITALWAARNKIFMATDNFEGIQQAGLVASLKYYGYTDVAILASERGHYSLTKAADLLGIGKKQIIKIPVNNNHQCDTQKLNQQLKQLEKQRIKPLAVVGIAGTTETGHVDPLREMSNICKEHNTHFHVDAAWGGPMLFSKQYSKTLDGISQADSVTFDAHKQLYVPMGVGLVLFKDPNITLNIKHSANYIIRSGSKDLGKHSLEGSRPGMSLLVHSALHIIGRQGYEVLIDHSIEKTNTFSKQIAKDPQFELTSEPQTNILTYRYIPTRLKAELESALLLKKSDSGTLINLNKKINHITIQIQKTQRAKGNSFVSRTKIKSHLYNHQSIDVFRVVLANPLTTQKHLEEILEEQKVIYRELSI